jgi:peptidyl-prolyl cis-trans isomerase A (cyclophilin A)
MAAMLTRLAFLPLLALPLPLLAQTAPPPAASAEAQRPRTVDVVLTTSEGPITIALEVERAPVTAANFLRYVDQKRFDGTTFYRAFTFEDQPQFGLVQGGTSNAPKRVLKPIAHEPTTRTGLHHGDGAVSMARGAPGSATGDFFIILGGLDSLDAHPDQPGDNLGFAVFGQVTQGMDVVRRIAGLPKDPARGAGAMKGQMLARPIIILTARRVSPAAPAPAPVR